MPYSSVLTTARWLSEPSPQTEMQCSSVLSSSACAVWWCGAGCGGLFLSSSTG